MAATAAPASSPDPPAAPASRRRRRIVARVAAALVAAAVIAYVLFATVLELPGGPLDGFHGSGRFAMKVGDKVTIQEPDLANTSGHTVTLISIEPADMDEGIRFLGARATLTGLDGDVVQAEDGWPPDPERLDAPWKKATAPVDGFEVPSRGGGAPGRAVLVVGLQITKPGRHGVHSWRITYRDRGIRRVVTTGGENSLDTGGR